VDQNELCIFQAFCIGHIWLHMYQKQTSVIRVEVKKYYQHMLAAWIFYLSCL